MKSTGMIRRIDDLGRIVVPKEIRRTLRISEGDPFEIFFDTAQNMVCFQKYQPEENPIDSLKRAADTFSEFEMFAEEKQVRELIDKVENLWKAKQEK